MAVIDSRGRLFGKVSVIDIGASLIVLVALIAIFLVPGNQSSAVAPVGGRGATQPVEVDVISRGLSVRSLDLFEPGSKANIIIRNQPYGQVEVKKVEDITIEIPVVMPDGEIRQLPREQYRADVVLTVAGNAQVTGDGIVLGNAKVKNGVTIELETFDYLVRGMVMDVRLLEETS